MTEAAEAGRVTAVSGAVVRAETDRAVCLGEIVRVGAEKLLGEIVELRGRELTAQVYEDTTGIAPGDPIETEGVPLSLELGPGLLGQVFDGIQRPLERLAETEGDYLGRGRRTAALDRDRIWDFEPRVAVGDAIHPGQCLGAVRETSAIEHRILAPPDLSGRLLEIGAGGGKRVEDTIARIETTGGPVSLCLFQKWRVRAPRPVRERLSLSVPLVTGQRVLDTFFPLGRGGAAGMPGGFGTGKTVTQQQLCKWAWADVIVFVGCGERGNEMTRVLEELPQLQDPRSARPLSERTVLVANTSNMPVAAREASIYTAVTIAEYYRDMGYHVAVLADSTSRWAEALREISGRLSEIPAEEGYPSYLSSRLAAFYERAGRVTTLDGAEGSVSIISAISPPGGDLTEPVTRHTRRFTRCFWTLDKERAEARIFPAVSIQESDAEWTPELAAWWSKEVSPDFAALRQAALGFLHEAAGIERTARLIGTESLPEKERFLLRAASLFEEGYLRQSAFDPKDAFCSPARQARLLSALMRFRERGLTAVSRGIAAHWIAEMPLVTQLERAKSELGEDALAGLDALAATISPAFDALEARVLAEATDQAAAVAQPEKTAAP